MPKSYAGTAGSGDPGSRIMKTSLITATALSLAVLGIDPSNTVAAPATHDRGTWAVAPSMLAPASGHLAVGLHDGRVLAIGGEPSMQETPEPWVQLYDPAARAWSFTGAMHTGRVGETATVLQDGRVLVVGGIGPGMDDLSSAEIFDPRQGSWQLAASLPQTRFSHSASLLPDGRVLVVGGIVARRIARSTLLYDSLHDRWESGPPTHSLHAQQSSVTLRDGRS
jgi:Kelch motif